MVRAHLHLIAICLLAGRSSNVLASWQEDGVGAFDRDRLGEIDERIRFLECVFETRHVNLNSSEEPPPARFRMIAARDGRFVFSLAHGFSQYEREHDPFRATDRFGSMRRLTIYDTGRAFQEAAYADDAALPNDISRNLFFVATGIWPFESRAASSSVGFSAALRYIRDNDSYRYVGVDRLDGDILCYVFESTRNDKVWICFEPAATIAKRELYNPTTGALAQSIVASDFREIWPGVVIPFYVSSSIYDAPGATARQRTIMQAELRVLAAMANDDVVTEQFEYELIPGMLKIESDGSLRQVMPGGMDYMDDVANLVRQTYPVTASVGRNETQNSLVLIFSAVATGISICVLWYIWRASRRTSLH